MADRTLLEWVVVTVFCAAVAAVTTGFGWMWRMDLAAYDASMSLAAPSIDENVVIVAIDDPSLAEIGRWPWRRTVHASLIERLTQAGAKVIAFDVILHEPNPENPQGDQVLAGAIAASGRVVLPVIQASRGDRIVGEALPAPMFEAGAAALGHIHVEFDPDGIARSVYLWEGFGEARHPQLGLAILKLVDARRAVSYARKTASTGEGVWHREQWLRIPFTGPPGSYPTISYADVLRGEVDDAVFRDKVVFVGATALGMTDSVPTPTSGFHRPMPGVEVNASVYAALVRGDAIKQVPPALAGAIAAIIVIVLMVVMLRTQPRAALVWAFSGALATAMLMWGALSMARTWLPLTGAVLGCMLCYPLWSWRRLEAAQRHLDEQLEILHQGAARLFPGMPADPLPVHEVDPVRRRIRRVALAIEHQRNIRRFMTETLDSLPVGAVVTDLDGRILLCNREAMSLLNARDPVQMLNVLSALDWPPGIKRDSGIPLPDTAGGITSTEVEGPDNTCLMVQVAGLRDIDGKPIGRVIGLSDITRIRDAHRSREETMHYLSHDLRSPIASILTLIEAEKLADEVDPERLEFLRQLGRYANSALKLADDLFRLARADAIDQTRFIEFNLASAVQDAIDESWALARGKSVRVGFDLDDSDFDASHVVGDQELVRRAILNLLTNAIKYGPEGGAVNVGLAREGDQWSVSVSDEGEGIDPAHMAGLFRRFGRLKTKASRREKGIGLGLMIVKTVAERHGGSVGVESHEGAGATFCFRLPVMVAND